MTMDLSSALLVAAVLSAVVAAIVGQRGRDYLGPGAMIAALTALAAMTILIFVLFAAFWDLDQFGLIHLLYLVGVVGIPVVGISTALLARFYKRGTSSLPALVVLALAPAALGIYGTHVEPFNLRVDAHRVEVAGMNRAIRFGVLADLQATTISDYENETVDELLAANPQIVLIPGDLWQMSDEEYAVREPEFVELIRRIVNAVDVVVMVEGDHDNLVALRRLGSYTGAIVLADQVLELQIGAQPVLIAGISDEKPNLDDLFGRLSDADPATLTIMVSHWPEIVEESPSSVGVDLFVAGHTHGGQLAIPGFGPLISFSDLPRDVAAGGLHNVGDRLLYVSTGAGVQRGQAPQVRLGVRPTIGVLDIVGP